jgi:hypothetical protein
MARILESPTITSTDHATFMVGVAGKFTFTTAMRSFPSSFSASGRLPSSVTFRSMGNGTAILEGSPDLGTVGRYPIRVTASDGEGQDVCQEFILAVHRTTPPRAVAVTSPNDEVVRGRRKQGQGRDQGSTPGSASGLESFADVVTSRIAGNGSRGNESIRSRLINARKRAFGRLLRKSEDDAWFARDLRRGTVAPALVGVLVIAIGIVMIVHGGHS